MSDTSNRASSQVPLRFVPVRPGIAGSDGVRPAVFRAKATPIAVELWWDDSQPEAAAAEPVDDGHTYIELAGYPLGARFRAEGGTVEFSQYHLDMAAGQHRREVKGTEFFQGYPEVAYDGAFGAVFASHLEITHDGESDEVVVYCDIPTPVRQPGPDVPVYYRPITSGASTVFSVSACPSGGRVEVDAKVGNGEVFAGSTLGSANNLDWNDDWVSAGGHLSGPFLHCQGGTVELLNDDDGGGWDGRSSAGRFAVTHDGTSDFILVAYGTQTPARPFQMKDMVAIRYQPAGLGMNAKFDVNRCPKDGRVVVNGRVFTNTGGNVFSAAGSRVRASVKDEGVSVVRDPVGPYLTCVGGTVEFLKDDVGEGWSGDIGTGRFAVTHDGVSDEIVVTFGTRPD